MDGIADDMDFSRGLQALMKLLTEIEPSLDKLSILDLIRLKKQLSHYLNSIGLTNGPGKEEIKSDFDCRALEKFIDFRSQVRSVVLNGLRERKIESTLQKVLQCCDNIRESAKNEGVYLTDK